jgi:hypothetical protein
MTNFSTDAGQKEIITRVERLTPNSQPLWGKMNVAQMLAHLSMTTEVPLGTHTLKPMFIMKLIGGMIRKKILSDKPLSKNSPTAPTLAIVDQRDFETEKQQLLKTLEAFIAKVRKGDLPEKHPYFGKMSASDWSFFQQRHFDHHLQQFGV